MTTDAAYYPELLTDMAAQAERLFIERDIPQDKAHQVAWDLVEFLRSHWGKQTLYIPEAMSVDARKRAAAMWAEFNGQNIAELAKKYDVTLQHAYRCIRFMRAEQVLATQTRLFEDEPVSKPNLR